MADKNRMNRVDEQLKEEISKIINQEIQDPHLTQLQIYVIAEFLLV